MKTRTVGAFDAKTHLSQLLDQVAHGEKIKITRRGKPVAILVPYEDGINADKLNRLIAQVREERGTYHVTSKEITGWKKEGRK